MWKCLICITLLLVTDVVVCKPDYIFNEDVKGWLKLHPVAATWQEAFLTCHYEGVPLADLSITWGTYANNKSPQEECLYLSKNYKTYITSCTLSFPYVCYKRHDNTTVLNQCGTFDNDYHFYRATGSCYKYHKKPRSWYTAHKICAAEGGHLVIPNDQQEVDIITDFMEKPTNRGKWGEQMYIGLRDWDEDQTYLTIHGEEIENVFHTWAEGVTKTNPCVTISNRGFLDTSHCLLKKRFVCEKDPNTSRFEDVCSADNCVATN